MSIRERERLRNISERVKRLPKDSSVSCIQAILHLRCHTWTRGVGVNNYESILLSGIEYLDAVLSIHTKHFRNIT